MGLTRTEDQDELASLVRRFLAAEASLVDLRELIDSDVGPSPAAWLGLARLDLCGLAIPEAYGGLGQGPEELAVVMEELGRVLYGGPYFSTVVLGVQALLAGDDEEARARWLPGIAQGKLRVALATADLTADGGPEDGMTVATRTGEGWLVSGPKSHVIDGHLADVLLVTARSDEGPGLFAVTGDAPGLTRIRQRGLDLSRHVALVELSSTPAIRIRVDDIDAWFARVFDHAAVALAAEQLGGAARCLEAAVEHARVREQFERPIGSFQAIKHKCAQMLVAIESARSGVRHAASVVAAGGSDASVAALVARVSCSEAFTEAAKENIQIHGGIGYTWEHDAHLFLRRAKSSELILGSPRQGRMRLADLLQS